MHQVLEGKVGRWVIGVRESFPLMGSTLSEVGNKVPIESRKG